MLFPEITEILDPEPHGAALNMAIDEVLLERAEQPLLRIYRWKNPALSVGYFAKFSEFAQLAGNREKVRRWTGGGVVEHGADFTYSLIVPRANPFFAERPSETYRQIHEVIAGFLQCRGLAVDLARVSEPAISSACFENPVAHDVVHAQGKAAGAAQRRTRAGLLHQGSIGTFAAQACRSGSFTEAFAPLVWQRACSASELARAEILALEKYGTRSWTERF